MGLIHQSFHAMSVSKINDCLKVRTDSVVGRIVDKDSFRIGVFLDGPLNVSNLHSQRNSQVHINLRINIYRNCSAQNKGVDCTLMNVSGHDDLLSHLHMGKNHCLHGTCCSVYHHKSMGCTKGIGHELFCFFYNRNRVTQIIKRFHGIYINAYASLSQKPHQFGISPAPLMPRHVKRNYSLLPETLQCFIYRGSSLLF